MKYLKAVLFLLIVISLVACSSTIETAKHTETVKHTEETITIEPMTVPVPEIKGKFDVPLVKVDTVLNTPYGVYESEQVIETTDPLTKKITKAVMNIKSTLKKDKKGKPILEHEVKAQQGDIKTDGKVKYSKKSTDSSAVNDSKKKTEGLFVVIWNSIKWWLLIVFIIAIPVAILIKKIGWPVIKKFIGIP